MDETPHPDSPSIDDEGEPIAALALIDVEASGRFWTRLRNTIDRRVATAQGYELRTEEAQRAGTVVECHAFGAPFTSNPSPASRGWVYCLPAFGPPLGDAIIYVVLYSFVGSALRKIRDQALKRARFP